MNKKHKRRQSDKFNLTRNVGSIVMISMILMLFISIVAEIFIPTYKTNPLFYGLIGGVGGLFYKSISDRN